MRAVDLFADMEQVFSQKIEEKGIAFLLEVDPGLPEALVLDGVRLRQILLNLISNAVKFTDEGHVKLAVHNQHPDGDTSSLSLIVEVEDTGIGIPEGQLESIFGAFEQQPGQSHAAFGGTGLGLAITKRLVEMMDGEIWVTSEQDVGSTFHVTLHEVAVAAVNDLADVAEGGFNPDAITFASAVVLVADDVEANRHLLRGYLEPYGFKIFDAANGQEAVDVIRECRPDIVLMDMKMPVMDGYEATDVIKTDDDVRHTPIIAVTASAMRADEHEIRDLLDGYLSKPVSRGDLVTELAKFLDHAMEGVDEAGMQETRETEEAIQAHALGLSPEVVAALPKLLDILVSKTGLCQELRETMSISGAEEFGGEMQTLGTEYGYPPLAEWGEKMVTQATMFELAALSNTLERLPSLIEGIQTLAQQQPWMRDRQ